MAAGLALAAAAVVAALPRSAAQDGGATGPAPEAGARPGAVAPPGQRPAAPVSAPVSAPVRIADAATVRLLRPGDRVDVLAAPEAGGGPAAVRVVARSARVAKVPEPPAAAAHGDPEGALVVLAVERSTATALAGASVTSRLAVTLC
ncbi:RcpC/CpaB family pilus assembly protein [Streptomyces sp. NPDC018031]|uniref:RcpC/CpaB family pilus assembly protein n=1 Tax=Streptomyces sp. NPDC018031 TaxID=3365033 RepID=UPI0037A33B78